VYLSLNFRYTPQADKTVLTSKTQKNAGRPVRIKPEQWSLVLKRSEHLFPAIRPLDNVRRIAPRRSLNEVIEFLKPDYPEQMTFLSGNIPHVEATFADQKLLATVKTLESRFVLLADALAGAEFFIEPSYARRIAQRVRSARARLKKQSRAARLTS
jgi:hypothetical protein